MNKSLVQLSDRELIEATTRVAAAERRSTVELLTLLGEFDRRRLYLGEGYSSLFTYCTQALHLSEHAAYHRIEAARAARQFPVLIDLVAEGALTLTTVALLRPHLTAANCERVLASARYKSKREVQHQIADLAPKPDEKALIRRLPTPRRSERSASDQISTSRLVPRPGGPSPTPTALAFDGASAPASARELAGTPPRATLAPLAPGRYLLKVTVSTATHGKLRRAQDLLRHTIPDGDTAAILDRALTLLVGQLENKKLGRTDRPRPPAVVTASVSANGSRHVPAAIRRAVWARDQGRCTFRGAQGQCAETGQLEFHHLEPFASGGRTEVGNLALRCRAHNRHESDEHFCRRWSAR